MLTLLLACVPKTPEIPAPTADQAAPVSTEEAAPAPEPGCVPLTTVREDGSEWMRSPWGEGTLSPAQLDADPEEEALLYLEGSCGTSGVCEHQVLDPCAAPDHYRSLGRLSAQEWRVGAEQSEGYQDLVAATHWMDHETGQVREEEQVLAFDGTAYSLKPAPLAATETDPASEDSESAQD